MKYNSVFFFLFLSTLSLAQIRTGVLAGADMMIQNNSAVKQDDEILYLPAWHLGVLLAVPVTEHLSFQAGLNYQLKGCKKEFTAGALIFKVTWQQDVKYHYMELPLNFSYTFKVKTFTISPYAGMYAALAVSGEHPVQDASGDVTIESINFNKDARRPDYGCQFGVGVELNKIFVRLQYSPGFADIGRVSGETTKNSGFGLSLGYWIMPFEK